MMGCRMQMHYQLFYIFLHFYCIPVKDIIGDPDLFYLIGHFVVGATSIICGMFAFTIWTVNLRCQMSIIFFPVTFPQLMWASTEKTSRFEHTMCRNVAKALTFVTLPCVSYKHTYFKPLESDLYEFR